MPNTQPDILFKFQSPEGWELCRKILHKRLPFGPHDYQLKGITSILDGRDLLAVSATGSGKSAYIYMTMHVILAIVDDPSLCPTAKFPDNPAMLVIYPTTALEENQEAILTTKLGLSAKAINSITKAEAAKDGINVWMVAEEQISVILISPEMLSSSGFGNLIASKKFQSRLVAIGVDEVHLLDSWGESFRPAFRQIAYIRARFSDDVVTFGLTATLRVGHHEESVCRFLGLHPGRFTFLRRSNARPDIQYLFREFNASQASDYFPTLNWIPQEEGKVLIFCSTIRYGFKIAVYFWHLDPCDAVLRRNIRLFNSLNSADYNRETLELLEGNANSKITIATDKLSVGVDVSDFQTVVIIGPNDLDDLCQKAGRVGRDAEKIKNPKVIIYVPAKMMQDARLFCAAKEESEAVVVNGGEAASGNKRKRRKKVSQGKLDSDSNLEGGRGGLYATIMAKCHTAEIDRQYGNPTANEPCSQACQTCRASTVLPQTTPIMCNCSACIPEATPPPHAQKTTRKPQFPVAIRVTQDMRKVGKEQLHQYREFLWESADEQTTGMIPIESYLPDTLIDKILDAFPSVLSKLTIAPMISIDGNVNNIPMANELLKPFVRGNPALGIRSDELVKQLWLIHLEFDRMCVAKKNEARAKREAKKQALAVAHQGEVQTSDEASESDSEDKMHEL